MAASFFGSPQSDPAAMVLGMLPAAQLCLMARVSRASAHLARRDMLWARLYSERWATRVGIPASRSPGLKDFRIRHLIERDPARFARSDPDERFRFCLTVKRRLERPVPPVQPANPPMLEAVRWLDMQFLKQRRLSDDLRAEYSRAFRHGKVMDEYRKQHAQYELRLKEFESELSGEDADGPYQSVFEGTVTSSLTGEWLIQNDEYQRGHLSTTELREQLKQYRASLYVQRISDCAMACIWADQPADFWTKDRYEEFTSQEYTPEFCPVDFVTAYSTHVRQSVPIIENTVVKNPHGDSDYVSVSVHLTVSPPRHSRLNIAFTETYTGSTVHHRR